MWNVDYHETFPSTFRFMSKKLCKELLFSIRGQNLGLEFCLINHHHQKYYEMVKTKFQVSSSGWETWVPNKSTKAQSNQERMLKVQAPFQSTSAHWIHECQTNPRASNEYTNAHRIHKGIQIYKCSSSKKGNLTFLKYPYILKYTYTHTHHMYIETYIYKHIHLYPHKMVPYYMILVENSPLCIK